MSDLGHLLKKARMDRAISLDQLEEMTKIRKRYLEAIEEGDYKILPGSFYVRAFIKSYSESVGLDPNEVLALYGSAIPTPAVESAGEPARRRKRNDSRSTEKLSKWASSILMLSFVLLILGVLYYFISISHPGDSTKQVNPSDKITDKLPDETIVQSDGNAASGIEQPDSGKEQNGQASVPTPPPTPVVTLARTENNIDYYVVTNADKLNVKLNIPGDECWLKIDRIVPPTAAGGKEERLAIEEKLYKKGDTRDWTSETGVFLRIGFPPAAEVIVNGTPIPLGSGKSVKQIQVDLQKKA